jgi:hypothetical protein
VLQNTCAYLNRDEVCFFNTIVLMNIRNEYDTKKINHREDTDLTWKTLQNEVEKTTGVGLQDIYKGETLKRVGK